MRPSALSSALLCLLASTLAASIALVAVGATSASAGSPAVFNGTQLFNEPFNTAFANGKGDEVLPGIGGGVANGACLTVAGNTTVIPKSCTSGTDVSNGALRLTAATASTAGSIFDQISVPTSKGLSATFEMHQYLPTGSFFADGMTFSVAAVDPANPIAPTVTGATGGPLGYSTFRSGGVAGLQHAYLGFGFDIFGNFSNNIYEGSTCTDPPYIAINGKVPGQAVVRGPGQGTVGYCALNSTASSTTSPPVAMHGTTRANSLITVAVGINPTARDLIDQNGVTIPAGQYLVQFTPIGGTLKTLSGALPTVAQTFYGAGTGPWITAAGIPKQLSFGWTASTGSVVDNHEITNAQVYSLSVVPQLTVSQTSYSGGAPAVGAPVTYVVNAGVATGADEPAAVSVTDTLPAGVKPESGAGVGWVCGVPSGQTITCTNSSTPFLAGSTLPALTIQGIVTTAGLTSTGIAANTVVTASSNDALPGLSTAATEAAPVLPPSSVTVSPTSGAKAGGGTITLSGTNVSSATTVQIGTAAEFNTGAISAFIPCPGGVAAAGCFTVSGSSVVISAMPAHASGAVLVRVVTFGVGDTATYTFTSVPSAPTVTATAGTTSAVVDWIAPGSTGGSPILNYLVTPIRDGVRGTTVSVGPTVRTQPFAGLDPQVPYTFEVVATNVNGSGNPGLSNEVVPYTVPGIPTGVTGVASDEAVVLSWVAPADTGGSPITSYTITPFINGVGQTPVTTPDAGTTFTVTGLTAGVAYKFRVRATNAAGSSAQSATSGFVTPNALPALSFPPPPPGEVSAPYSATLTVTGGTGPYVWTVDSGALPAGLSLASDTGVISGVPTNAGSQTAVIRVTDAAGKSATESATIVISAAPLISSGPPPSGEVGAAYSFAYTVAGGTGPFTWSVSAGALPAGLILNTSTGTLTGTPTTVGSSSFTVRVVDAFAVADNQAGTVLIVAGPSIDPGARPAGEVGAAYSTTYTVTGGTSPFTWSVSVGALPAGLTLAPATGVVSGTPTASGTTAFTMRVVDGAGQVATRGSSIDIAAVPTLTYPDTAGSQGSPLVVDPVVTGGTVPFSYVVTGGGLPTGLSLNPTTGRISGTPTQGGVFAPQITLTDTFGLTSTHAANFAISFSGTVTLFASSTLVNLGDTVTLTATVGPGTPTGNVEFDVVPATGPDKGTVVVLGTVPVAGDGTSSFTLNASAFGANAYTATYSGDGSHTGASSTVRLVEVAASVGQVIVEETRGLGPGGARDSFVQLTNLTSIAVPLAGFTIRGSSGQVVTLPSTTSLLLQPGHSYLLAGTTFSLDAFATPDLTYSVGLGAGGVRVVAPDTALTVTDAVGSGAGFSSGTPLPPVVGPITDQEAWTRQINYNVVQNTGDNLADFNLVSVTAGQFTGVQSVLGAPAPAGRLDPQRNNPGFPSSLLDPGRTYAQAPNRTYTKGVGGLPGTLIVRRIVTNTTAATITSANLRITAISQDNGRPPPGRPPPDSKVNLWLVDPDTDTSQVTLSDGSTVTVNNLKVTSTVGAIGGGLNSTLDVPLPGGTLAPGQSVRVALTFSLTGTGAFWFAYDADIR